MDRFISNEFILESDRVRRERLASGRRSEPRRRSRSVRIGEWLIAVGERLCESSSTRHNGHKVAPT